MERLLKPRFSEEGGVLCLLTFNRDKLVYSTQCASSQLGETFMRLSPKLNIHNWVALLLMLLLTLIAHPSYAQSFQAVPDRAESVTLPARTSDDFSPLRPRRTGASPTPFSISIDPLSQERKSAETATVSSPGTPYQIGFGRDIPQLGSAADTAAHLQWRNTPQDGNIAAISITSPQAVGIRLGILVRRLPAEATVRFYAQGAETAYEISGKEIMEFIKRNLDAGDGGDAALTYWSPHIEGEEATMEIELPPGTSPDTVEISIPRISHFFHSPLAAQGENMIKSIGDAASCEIDATCYSAWSPASNATAKMSYVKDGSSYVCTGTLLNDMISSSTPYFLSANHCISRQTVASTLQTYWFYRSASCNSGTFNPDYRTLTGGATLLYANSTTDTSFLRLSNTPPAGAMYAGWNSNAPALGTAVTGVHHPKGDLQKISFGSIESFADCTAPDPLNFACSPSTQTNAEYLNITFNSGITEGGSSGSGLFKTVSGTHYLIGQLYGGTADCSNPTGTNYYGRFDVAYTAKLHEWLNAGSTFSLSISKPGNGSGTVTSVPSGINCGLTCSAPFTNGTSVTLTAAPAAGSTFSGWSGACSGTGTSCSVVMNAAKSVTATFSTANISIGAALDNTSLVWTTGGNAPFTSQTATFYYGGSAAQTGRIGDNQSTYLSTNITGPGTLSFYWKVSSEQDYDFFSVYLDGVSKYYWSGSTLWYKSELTIPTGTHTVKWEYVKDAYISSGQDAGWVDNVVFTPSTTCTYTFSPSANGFAATSALGAVTVTPSSSSCSWTAASNASWITITSGSSVTGSGTVTYSVAANTTGSTRTGTMTVAGSTITVTQTGFNAALYFPHVATNFPWQTEIAIINISINQVTGTLRTLSDEGQLIETKAVTLSARGRRQIIIADEFTNHFDIGYIIFDTDSAAVQGYTKFYQAGSHRAAIPAVKEVNSSNIYISHIASTADWWTGVSLVNTTSAPKQLTITFNNGQSRQITLNANQHRAFMIESLFNNQPQPDLQSAVITNASGVIGLELFGSKGGAIQMDGILLTDKTASTIYYPHVASNDYWWTGIVAYNPSELACTITITPYSAQGTPLPPLTLPIPGKGKYIGVVSNLGLPVETAWFRINSTRPLSGFELFATVDGKQLAAYAGMGGTDAKTGVFAKIEKNGWTGIAFVNTEASAASVTLTAYNDNGTAVATRVLPVGGYAKVVNLTEAIFSQNINSATYIAFSSDRNVVGFQINGTSDGMMLDALPGLTVISTTPTNVNYNNTYLLKGTWTFAYTIGIYPFSNTYVLNSMDATPNSSGNYFIFGTSIYGDIVVGSYYSATGDWNVFDSGTIIDRFFVFKTDGTNVLSGGCYYQISHPSETWSQCYQLSGYKTNLKSLTAKVVGKAGDSSATEKEEAEKANQAMFSQPEESVKSMYLMLRGAAGK